MRLFRVLAATALLPAALAALSQDAPTVPADLRPWLVPRASEFRLVSLRYALDRDLLHGNYAGAGRDADGLVVIGGPPTDLPPLSTRRLARLKRLDLSWQAALAALDETVLSAAAREDLTALRATVARNLEATEAAAREMAALADLLPFAPPLVDLIESRIRIEPVDAAAAAGVLTTALDTIARARTSIADRGARPALARRAAGAVALLRRDVDEWFRFFDGYDPVFSWWMRMPHAALVAALDDYATGLNRDASDPRGAQSAASAAAVVPSPIPAASDVPDLAALMALPQDEMTRIVAEFRRGHDRGGQPADVYRRWVAALRSLDFRALSRNAQIDYLFIRRTSDLQIARAGRALPPDPPRKADASGITGDARGREGLLDDLADAMIPYTPEELLVLGDREFAWVVAEMRRTSLELGFGDDWKRALEHVKDMHPPPGGQPFVIREMLVEAVDYLRANDLMTVPQPAAESMQIVMLTPAQQLINPFFRGGARMSLSYPTDTMTYEQRIQSMRGNNTPFSHATAHHEMIPGHYFDLYTSARHAGYRADLGAATPFFREGWALYWELLLYDRGFNDTPEERLGALFWRLHRSARIVFSLRFHLGHWSPQEAVDFLVDEVGHERENAMAEVRRSFGGTYSPLYQAAYLLGGLQIRSLHRELVESGRMTARAFHDEVMRQGSMPIALLRLAVSDQPLAPDTSLDWRFYGDLAAR